MMGRRFDLREGAVNLSGPLAQTAVALKAEYRAPSPSGTQPVVITTAVQSDSGKLTVTLSSIPVMRSEDIMSYLTTGRPASTDPTLASDEQDALSTTASLAVGAALGTVAGSAGQKLGFDVVQVLQDRDGGQTLVAGKYVSPPLYLGFRQPIVPVHRSRELGYRDRRGGVRGGVRRVAPTAAQPSGRRKRVPHLPPAPAVIGSVSCRSRLAGLLPGACMLLVATGVAAQDSIPLIRPRAQVGSVDFRFQSQQSFSTSELGGVIALKGRGSLYGVRQLLGKLPFIGSPAPQRFDPVELQKDVVRLRRFYERSGFLDPDIDYRVEANPSGTLVDVTFLVHEGPAVTLRELRIHLHR